ncbi:hypothetical protein FE374_00755 [Georgenia yuyongxinii]|uniref:Glucose/Sorbosone dehydrogenase domain-containing protein n=1 Tax=Georgenia yuyongxinii TaxID=2589797 RepID=A0A5B8C033_9MICO|nr:glucose/sorbosone family PQQ-dependent dehydrogenase [Georgenia yuyongxinii]QDC23350.1 hypothetical protein FE374_00755 [Georgenia yuyongxinii]
MRRVRAAVLGAALVIPLSLALPSAVADERSRHDDDVVPAGEEDFDRSVLTTDLSDPFEVTYGPDGNIWATERTAGRVTLVDPDSGEKTTILTIDDVLTTPGEQDGLLGMALHPDLLKKHKNQYVYLAYTYEADGTGPEGEDINRRTRIVRYTYDDDAQQLVEPKVLIEDLIGSDDHNSGRLVFRPDGTLHYTIGDRGNLQDHNACKVNQAQRLPTAEEIKGEDWTAYQGKTLRLNLDGTIPKDNPKLNGVRSHIFTYGHRNPQGLVVGPGDRIYSSEQGPKSDDELNLLEAGGNYGWPNVAGFKDDQAYVFGNWAAWEDCTPEQYNAFEIPDQVPQMAEHEFNAPNFVPPLRTFYTVPTGTDFSAEPCEAPLFFICYPTVAPSSLDWYEADAIPGWENSFLMPTLKLGTLFRLPVLDDNGRGKGHDDAARVIDGGLPLFVSQNRYRDTAISPDGGTIYVATDSGGLVRDLDTGASTDVLADPGAILAFRYTGAD